MEQKWRAKRIKIDEVEDGVFKLKQNTPMLINKNHNSIRLLIHEEHQNEDCFIHSQFGDEAFAMVGKEFHLNFYDNPKRADLSYYYFSKDATAIVYLYDIKKTFSGIETMVHLVEQWKSSICDARYCVEKAEISHPLDPSNIHIGVITENDDAARRNCQLQELFQSESSAGEVASFVESKHRVGTLVQSSKAKILTGFDKGKVTIGNITYDFNVRTFVEKKHDMHFIDGILQP